MGLDLFVKLKYYTIIRWHYIFYAWPTFWPE